MTEGDSFFAAPFGRLRASFRKTEGGRFFASLRMTGRVLRMTGREHGPEGHDRPREGPEGFVQGLSKLLIINSFLPPPREPGERIGNGAICGYSGHSEQYPTHKNSDFPPIRQIRHQGLATYSKTFPSFF